MPSPSNFFDLEGLPAIFDETQPVWNALDLLKDYIQSKFDKPGPLTGIVGHIDKSIAIHNGELHRDIKVRANGKKGAVQAFCQGKLLEGAAVIMAGAWLFDDRITIGPGTVIEPGALIKGPTVVGENTEIRQGAYIRGNCLVGDGCVVGHTTELKGSIMLDGAKAGHFAYIGDSILGRDVNLGAGTKMANLKVIPGSIVLRANKQNYDTGRRKLGAILGDQSETGCNSVTSPGTLIGPQSIIYPGVLVPAGIYGAKTYFSPAKGAVNIQSFS
jgi:bifunctional UDP-N-acetylglucosamine pyrophosphorylase / glucosamine-1-phosphate N-acetyltransferase